MSFSLRCRCPRRRGSKESLDAGQRVPCIWMPRSFFQATLANLSPHPVLMSSLGSRGACISIWLTLLWPGIPLATQCQVWAACPGHQWLHSWALLLVFALASEIYHLSQPNSPDSADLLCPARKQDVKTILPWFLSMPSLGITNCMLWSILDK